MTLKYWFPEISSEFSIFVILLIADQKIHFKIHFDIILILGLCLRLNSTILHFVLQMSLLVKRFTQHTPIL